MNQDSRPVRDVYFSKKYASRATSYLSEITNVSHVFLRLDESLSGQWVSVLSSSRHIIRKVEIQPPKRMQQLEELERATLGGTRDMGPCGGFSTQYMCMCDYHALPYREEVAWDVDTIYLSHDTRELYLHDFDYLEQKWVLELGVISGIMNLLEGCIVPLICVLFHCPF